MLWATRLPLIVLLVGLGALAMLLPAVHAYVTRDLVTARAFLYSCVMFLFLFTMIALGTSNYNIRRQGRSHLISLFALFAALPAMLAVPFSEVVTDTTFGNAYIEMKGNEVFRMAVNTLGRIVDETLDHNKMKKSDIDWLVPHQANIRIINATAKKLGMSLISFSRCSSGSARVMSVSMKPGATVFTVIFRDATSRAIALLNPATPAFAAE